MLTLENTVVLKRFWIGGPIERTMIDKPIDWLIDRLTDWSINW